MERKFEIIVDKTNKPSGIEVEDIIPLSVEGKQQSFRVSVEEKTIIYLKNLKNRTEESAEKSIAKINNNEKINFRTLRTPEAKFQNDLLRIVYQNNVSLEDIFTWVKNTAANNKFSHSRILQKELESIIKGVESCYEAVISLQKKLEQKYPDKKIWIATNDYLDAKYQIDLLAMTENKNGSLEILHFVQVKSSNISDEEIKKATEGHQKYLDSLPHFIETLNKNEAAEVVEKGLGKELIDNESLNVTEEQLLIFGLALDQYIHNLNNLKNTSAKDFYELFKEGGGILNPFIVIGMLKNQNVIDEYRGKYFEGNKEVERLLKDTANDIPHKNEESIIFHNKNHVHSIMKSTEITSISMVKSNIISEQKLKLPFSKID